MMTAAADLGLASKKAKHRQRRIKRAGQTAAVLGQVKGFVTKE